MKTMENHVTAMIDFFIALLFGAAATAVHHVVIMFPSMPVILHLALQAAKGFMYLGSGVAGFVGGWKVLKSWFNKNKNG